MFGKRKKVPLSSEIQRKISGSRFSLRLLNVTLCAMSLATSVRTLGVFLLCSDHGFGRNDTGMFVKGFLGYLICF